MNQFPTLEDIDAIVAQIRARTDLVPEVALILGSGLGAVADSVQDAVRISTSDLEGWPPSTVEGHAGQLVLGQLEGQLVCVMQGRVHFYEGYSMGQVGLPIRVIQRLGADTLIVTNAAGAVSLEFDRGDLMLIVDHLNFIGMAGHSPLIGPNLDELGPRFPEMSRAYDRELMALAREAATEDGTVLREGVYVCLGGPSFETPADIRFLRMIGVDAVGMSTVPEVTVARHGGMRVLGVSGISNQWDPDGGSDAPQPHEEVLEAGKVIGPKLESLIRGVLRRL